MYSRRLPAPDSEDAQVVTTPEAVTDYRNQAWDFLAKSKEYLAEGDLHQACEKAWGAAAHMMTAVAAARGWEYEMHDQFRSAVRNARQWSRDERLRTLGYSSEALHKNYYQRKIFLDSEEIRADLDDVELMLNILQPLTD